MAIKIPDNLMNRPNSPGGMSDGTENVTRAFGNRTEQAAGFDDVQRGWGGVANEAAGMENRAAAQAAQQVTSSVVDAVQYVENIKLADEDSRQKSLFLRAEAKAQELRETLRADPNLASQSEDVQQMAYEVQRDVMLDQMVQSEGFSQPKIKKLVKDNSSIFRTSDSNDYNQRVLVPQMVAARKLRDGEDVGNIVGTAMAAQSPEATAKAVGLIAERYRTPEAYATYGAVNAQAFEQTALNTLKKGISDAFIKQADDVMADAPKQLGLEGPLTKDAVTEGPMAQMIVDQLLKQELNLVKAGATDGERFLARENFQKTLQQAARASIATHNEAWKAQEKERKELNVSMITAMGDTLFINASSGRASEALINKAANATLRGLGIDPVAAAEGRLTDPEQIKLHHGVITQVARVTAEQRRVQRENARNARDIESLRLQREASIMPSTQKGSDLSFKEFAKSSGVGDKNPLLYTPEDWTKFNAYVSRTSPTHLPAAVEQAITHGLNSNDPSAVKAGMIAYVNLTKNAPGLAASVPVRTREIAVRLLEGQDAKSAKAAVDADAVRTPEQKAAINTIANKTKDEWRKGDAHPVAKEMGVKNIPPAVLAFADREYTDAIARGESPEVAKQTMMAKVAARTGKTTLLSSDGKPALSVNAPEVRFNVGVEKGPGWFAKTLGARDNPEVVTPDALREDIRDTLKQNGLPENQKYFLGQPVERAGTPYYPILLTGENGESLGPAIGKDGSAVLWTFDRENNPVMNDRREAIAKFDQDAAAAAEKKSIDIEHKTLMDEARRQGKVPQGAREFKQFEFEQYQQARKTVTGK
ncbi:hypothetical protein [Hydrogenophaga sp.]|uniref:hypothetical protein n=1 Tax=Hydrogenophaga sp. TaxID=1904254 RepID=UPI002FC73334